MILGMVSMLAVAAQDETGNGAPSGNHYTLNILAKDNVDDKEGMDGGNGGRIFIALEGNSKIQLQEDVTEPYDFTVIDPVASPGDPAVFELPNPYLSGDIDGTWYTRYAVYVRALGPLGKSADMYTTVVDSTGTYVYTGEIIELEHKTKGENRFQNVTVQLLTVLLDIDADGTLERVPLFTNSAYTYFWEIDNDGLRHAQLRFYEIPQEITQPGS
jgi:hypothetical protein